MRVTNSSITSMSLANLQASLQRGATLQAQLSSGKRINKASDDPSGTISALSLQGEIDLAPCDGRLKRNRNLTFDVAAAWGGGPAASPLAGRAAKLAEQVAEAAARIAAGESFAEELAEIDVFKPAAGPRPRAGRLLPAAAPLRPRATP